MKKLLILIFAALVVVSCKAKDEEPAATAETTTEDTTSIELTISGAVQKGPYQIGTIVNIQGLNANMDPITGKIVKTSISDDFGNFSGVISLPDSFYGDISACGYFFNEVTGSQTTEKFCSESLLYPSVSPYNLNIVTSLIRKRIKVLVLSGSSGQDAFDIATYELVKGLLKIDTATLTSANNWEITDASPLLTISAIALQLNGTIQELEAWVATIANDLEDGSILTENTEAFQAAAIALDTSSVQDNVDSFFSGLGSSAVSYDMTPWISTLDPTKLVSIVHSQGTGTQTAITALGMGATNTAIPFTLAASTSITYGETDCVYDSLSIYSNSAGDTPKTLIVTGSITTALTVRDYQDASGNSYGVTSNQVEFSSTNLDAGSYWAVYSQTESCTMYGSEATSFSQVMISTDSGASWSNLTNGTVTPRLIFLE